MRKIYKPSDLPKAIAWVAQYLPTLDPQKEYELSIKPVVKSRSLDANSYAWTLINQISRVMNIEPESVYKNVLGRTGGHYTVVPVKDDACDSWARIWGNKGIGWWTENLGPCKKTAGYSNVACYYGSSVFDTKEMSNLIDNLVQDAKSLGIDTLTPKERARLIDEW